MSDELGTYEHDARDRLAREAGFKTAWADMIKYWILDALGIAPAWDESSQEVRS